MVGVLSPLYLATSPNGIDSKFAAQTFLCLKASFDNMCMNEGMCRGAGQGRPVLFEADLPSLTRLKDKEISDF